MKALITKATEFGLEVWLVKVVSALGHPEAFRRYMSENAAKDFCAKKGCDIIVIENNG